LDDLQQLAVLYGLLAAGLGLLGLVQERVLMVTRRTRGARYSSAAARGA